MLALLLLACGTSAPEPRESIKADSQVHPALAAHSKLFEKQIVEVVPGVYSAVGFGLANILWLEGPEGIVIVDTGENGAQAREVLEQIRKRSSKPISAVILTHNHTDHVFGGAVFAGPDTQVWAHETTEALINRVVNTLRDAITVRSERMFGTRIPDDLRVNDGIGPYLSLDTSDLALARPTHTFSDTATVKAGGLTLELMHVPGETDDQLLVWWPQGEILFPGDNIYETFPNLYTIRGTPYRDVREWVVSLDKMRALEPVALVPSHTLPVIGQDKVEDVLTAYRDGIQYVYDQTIRGINAGKTPDQLAAEIHLPPHLAEHPWLIEHYGRVPWSVRSIYAGNLGWFNGRGATLEPLPPEDRAKRLMAAFAAGKPLPDQARAALEAGDASWAAELGQAWLDAEPENHEAELLLAHAYEKLAYGHINPNAYHWYLTQAMELRGDLDLLPPPVSEANDALIDSLPVENFLRAMPSRLKAEDTLDVRFKIEFQFTDTNQTFGLEIRHGVAQFYEGGLEQPDLLMTTDTTTYKRMVTNKISRLGALATGAVVIDGAKTDLMRFSQWFDQPD